jgi:hypothetical protein
VRLAGATGRLPAREAGSHEPIAGAAGLRADELAMDGENPDVECDLDAMAGLP